VQDALEVREQHLNFLALSLRDSLGIGLSNLPVNYLSTEPVDASVKWVNVAGQFPAIAPVPNF
jgi:hypothetical protein